MFLGFQLSNHYLIRKSLPEWRDSFRGGPECFSISGLISEKSNSIKLVSLDILIVKLKDLTLLKRYHVISLHDLLGALD